MTLDETKQAELEELAKKIAGEEIAEQTEERSLLKSLSLGLLDLLKGKKADPEPEPEPEGGDEDEDEESKSDVEAGGDEDGKPGEGAGYEDMRMAAEGEEMIDATDLILALHSVPTILTDLQARIVDLEKAVKGEGELTRQGIGAVLVPLAKAVTDTDARLREIPMQAVGPRPGVKEALRRHVDEAKPAVVHELTQVQLAKAMQKNIIEPDDLRHYKQHGAFPRPEDDNKALIEQIKAL